MGTPEQLIESTTRHAAHVERLKSHDVKVLGELLTNIEEKLLGKLARNDVTKWGRARAEKQLEGFRALLDTQYSENILPELSNQIKELGVYEAGFEARNLAEVAPTYNFTLPSETQIMSAIMVNPLSVRGGDKGKLLDAFTKDWTQDQIDRTVNTIRAGFAQGLTTANIISELANDTLPINRRGLTAMTRTALQHSAVQAREQTWKNNSDIVRKVRWLSTLDSRTSVQCQSLSGQEFPIDSGPRPPVHVNCRSSVIAVLDDRFKILEEGGTRSARDPQTGKVTSVPADQTYYGWLKGQPAKVQDSIIGPTRGKLLRDGGLTAQRFQELQLNKRWQPVTLDEMRKMEPIAFAKAGLDVVTTKAFSFTGTKFDGVKEQAVASILGKTTPDILRAISVLEKPKTIFNDSGKPYYQQLTRGLSFDPKDKGAGHILLHEYGHHVDSAIGHKTTGVFFKNVSTTSTKFAKAFEADRALLGLKAKKTKYDALEKINRDIYKTRQMKLLSGRVLEDFVIKKDSYRSLSDIVDAMTAGLFQAEYGAIGHGKSYYKEKRMRFIETFANLFAIRNDKAWLKAKAMFPNLAEAFDGIIREVK